VTIVAKRQGDICYQERKTREHIYAATVLFTLSLYSYTVLCLPRRENKTSDTPFCITSVLLAVYNLEAAWKVAFPFGCSARRQIRPTGDAHWSVKKFCE
jgi:hypothetical protein